MSLQLRNPRAGALTIGSIGSIATAPARLQAEELGVSQIQWPAEFATLTGDDQAEAQRAMKVQQGQFSARLAAISAQKGVLRQRASELGQQAEGYRRQIEANDRQQKLI